MKVEVKSVKTAGHLSHETVAYSASIYVDGKRIGLVRNDGQGGCNMYDWFDREAGRRLEEHAEAQETEHDFEKLDQFINALADEFEERKALKRKCKTHVLFRLKGDEEGSWRTIRAKFEPRVENHIRTKHGDNLEAIANETI